MNTKSTMRLSLFFIFCLVVCSVTTLLMGEIPWNEALTAALNRLLGVSSGWSPLLDERLPRLIVLLCTGASLAVAGAVMQALFNNPLASPMVLGITSGGSLFVLLLFLLGWHLIFPFALPLAAILGCLFFLLIIYALSYHLNKNGMTTLILTGIALSTVTIAIQGAILYALRHNWELVQVFSEWEVGSSIDRNWQHVHLQLPLTLVGLAMVFQHRLEINILSLGEEEALNLGVDVERVRWRLFLATSLLVGGSLAAMGIIYFFGLVLPHILRGLQGSDNRSLIPLCALGGAVSLVFLDLLLRIFHLHIFSIGTISAIMGGFFFFTLLLRMQNSAGVHSESSQKI